MTQKPSNPLRTALLAALMLTLAATLAACATPTPYEAATDHGNGFADQRLDTNHYRVTFAGNYLTPRETVDDYLLYRAAELTKQTGNDYFIVLEKNTERNVSYFESPPPRPHLYPSPYWYPYGWGYAYGPFYDPFWDYPQTIEPLVSYKAYATIAVYKGKKPKDDPNAFEADDVLARLGPAIVRPAPAAEGQAERRSENWNFGLPAWPGASSTGAAPAGPRA